MPNRSTTLLAGVHGHVLVLAGKRAIVGQHVEHAIELGLAVRESKLAGDRIVGGVQAVFAAAQ
ncbi:hypothetical protein [Nonomuraea sp. NPDC049400]|uniref:hypothetical protein n=1 Tax=Nonomuraea sp. NPDC049400 TaxID=3364352 RepID=UPI0037917D5C